MKVNIKKYAILLLKYAFAGGIIYYMFATGKLDLVKISEILERKMLILRVVVSLIAIYALMGARWYYLLKWQGVPASLRSVVRIQCISVFFSSFMPGAVGGDLIKAYYIAKENTNYRTRAIVSIIVDRFIGLETLMIISFIALLINYQLISTNHNIQMVAISIGIYIAVSFVALAVIFTERSRQFLTKVGIFRLFKALPKGELLIKIYDALNSYSEQKTKLTIVLGITAIIDIIFVLIFYAIGKEMGESALSLPSYFTAIPVGILATTIPITPGGIGIGQSAFYAIFLLFGCTSGVIGATIISVYQIIALLVNMCFVVVYIDDRSIVRSIVREK
jgi:glycosyltransferase 2 family protein